MSAESKLTEAARLEQLWGTQFGDEYIDRNLGAGAKREEFWGQILGDTRPDRVLEVGSNVGENLRWVSPGYADAKVVGIDINHKALSYLKKRLPNVGALRSAARALPFADGTFDLTYTVGVLIHQPPDTLPDVMREIVRCSGRFVLCAEYFAEQPTEVFYRGHTGALFKRDFGALYQELAPSLQLRRRGWVGADDGFDDVTYWLFEKSPE